MNSEINEKNIIENLNCVELKKFTRRKCKKADIAANETQKLLVILVGINY